LVYSIQKASIRFFFAFVG